MSRHRMPLLFSAIVSLGVVGSTAIVAKTMASRASHAPAVLAPAKLAASTEVAQPAETANAADPNDPNAGHGSRRLRRGLAPVRVDGLEIAVLSAAELPSGLSMVSAPKHETVRFYRVGDYLRALDVNVAKVRAVHFIGNRDRVASIEGDELRARPAHFVFDFTRTTEGTPSVRWDTTGLKNPKRIDGIAAVEIFLADAPRAVDASLGCYARADGGCEENVAPEAVHGTRVYLDGRIVAHVKRREVERESASSVPLGRMLKIVGVDTSAVAGFELVGDDDVALRAAGPDTHDRLWQVTLAATRGAHGRPTVQLDQPVAIDAVLLHRAARTAQL